MPKGKRRVVSGEKQDRLSAERLREVVSYCPDSGCMIWRVPLSRNSKVGHEVGSIGAKGYRMVGIDHRYYLVHRLAWLYHFGCWPSEFIDHINGDKSDNRIANLRAATNSQNLRNMPLTKRNKSGVKGVCWHAKRRRWVAEIRVDTKLKHIGYFSDLNEAARAYENVAREVAGPFVRLD